MIFSLLQTEYNYDFVTIYDGPNDQSTQIKMLSGYRTSLEHLSTGNSLFVKFESDGSVTEDGFHATIHYSNAAGSRKKQNANETISLSEKKQKKMKKNKNPNHLLFKDKFSPSNICIKRVKGRSLKSTG